MEKKNIKLLIAYNKKSKVIKSDILTPIQTGRDISEEIFPNMILDTMQEPSKLIANYKNNYFTYLRYKLKALFSVKEKKRRYIYKTNFIKSKLIKTKQYLQ